jgi:hypothetical protein
MIGWGRRIKSWVVKDKGVTKKLTCRYNYFSILVFFKLILSKQWFIVGEKRSEDREITSQQAQKFLAGKSPFNFFEQYGLLILLALIFLVFAPLGMFK